MKLTFLAILIILATNLFGNVLQKQKLLIVEYNINKNDTTIIGEFKNVFLNNENHDKDGAYVTIIKDEKYPEYSELATHFKLISIINKDTNILISNAESIKIEVYNQQIMHGQIAKYTFPNKETNNTIILILTLFFIIILLILLFYKKLEKIMFP